MRIPPLVVTALTAFLLVRTGEPTLTSVGFSPDPAVPTPGAPSAGANDVVYVAERAPNQLSLENRLMTVPGTGGTPRELFSPRCLGIAPSCEFANPAWSPDGRRLAFAFRGVTGETQGNWQLRIATASGSAHWTVTDHAGASTRPTWSSDGRTMAYQTVDLVNGRYLSRINVVNLCGRLPARTPTRLTDGAHPSFSEDGSWIAYTQNGDIYKIRKDGTGRTRLTTDPGQDVDPAWTKPQTTTGADQIAFASNRQGSSGYDIYMMNADGSNVRRITRGAGNERSPDLPESPFFVVHVVESGNLKAVHASSASSTRKLADGWAPAFGTSGKVKAGCPPT